MFFKGTGVAGRQQAQDNGANRETACPGTQGRAGCLEGVAQLKGQCGRRPVLFDLPLIGESFNADFRIVVLDDAVSKVDTKEKCGEKKYLNPPPSATPPPETSQLAGPASILRLLPEKPPLRYGRNALSGENR